MNKIKNNKAVMNPYLILIVIIIIIYFIFIGLFIPATIGDYNQKIGEIQIDSVSRDYVLIPFDLSWNNDNPKEVWVEVLTYTTKISQQDCEMIGWEYKELVVDAYPKMSILDDPGKKDVVACKKPNDLNLAKDYDIVITHFSSSRCSSIKSYGVDFKGNSNSMFINAFMSGCHDFDGSSLGNVRISGEVKAYLEPRTETTQIQQTTTQQVTGNAIVGDTDVSFFDKIKSFLEGIRLWFVNLI